MAATFETYNKRETIYRAGDNADTLPKLTSGAVILYTILEDGRRQVLDLAGPGDFLHFEMDGEIDHFAEALVPSEVAYYPANELLTDTDSARFLLEQMGERLTLERRHITMLSRKSANERLQDFVRLAADCLGEEQGRFNLPLTRQQIADFTGLTLETVSRTFAQWQREAVLTKLSGHTYQMSDALCA